MVRRSFRIGLWIGLLLGVALALRRTMQLRQDREAVPTGEAWPPVPAEQSWPPIPADEPTAPPGLTVVDTFDERVDEIEPEEWQSPEIEEPYPSVEAKAQREAERIDTRPRSTPSPAPPLQSVPDAPPEEGAAAPVDGAAPPAPTPAPAPPTAPPATAAAEPAATRAASIKRTRIKKPAQAWVEAQEGACPTSHPVKAKLSSGIFHLPGMFAYDRTKADRCYATPDAAEADGLTRAKR
jgi:hypothetical protein